MVARGTIAEVTLALPLKRKLLLSLQVDYVAKAQALIRCSVDVAGYRN